MKISIPFLYTFASLCFLNYGAYAQSKTANESYPSKPVLVTEDTWGNKSVMDWIQPAEICENCKDVWTNQKGSSIWFEEVKSGKYEEILESFAQNNDLSNFQILAKESLKKAHLLDNEGYGWTVIAAATKQSQKYKLAAILVYGSLDESPKSTGVHAYLAKEEDFICSGAWVVPASFWLGIDPNKDAGDLPKQGLKDEQEQVKIFAQLSDIWIESIYQAYILQMQANVKALHNLRISAIAAWDPNAIVVPGDNGYKQIEYKHD